MLKDPHSGPFHSQSESHGTLCDNQDAYRHSRGTYTFNLQVMNVMLAARRKKMAMYGSSRDIQMVFDSVSKYIIHLALTAGPPQGKPSVGGAAQEGLPLSGADAAPQRNVLCGPSAEDLPSPGPIVKGHVSNHGRSVAVLSTDDPRYVNMARRPVPSCRSSFSLSCLLPSRRLLSCGNSMASATTFWHTKRSSATTSSFARPLRHRSGASRPTSSSLRLIGIRPRMTTSRWLTILFPVRNSSGKSISRERTPQVSRTQGCKSGLRKGHVCCTMMCRTG